MLTRLRQGERDSGLSLADLLVSVLLMGLLMTMCVTGVVTGSRSAASARDRADGVIKLEQAVQRTARHLRAVAPLLTATATGFSAYEVRGAGHWYVTVSAETSAGVTALRYREWSCGASACVTPPAGPATTTKTLLTDLRVPVTPVAAGQWFRYSYVDAAGVVQVSSTPPAPLTAVYAVTFFYRSGVPGLPPVESGTTVALRNSTASTSPA